MVTRILSILFLALPCLGQVAFTFTDQPFLETPVSSAGYATNLTFRWVASDLASNSFFSTWTDQISGRVLVTNGSTFTNSYANGVWSQVTGDPSSGGLMPSEGMTVAIAPFYTNYSIGFMLSPDIVNSGGSCLACYQGSPAFDGFYYMINVDVNRYDLRAANGDIEGRVQKTDVPIDICVIQTNNAAGTQMARLTFTNGVLAFVKNLGLSTNGPPSTFFKRGSGFGNSYQGFIREIWYRTNGLITFADCQAHASDLHYTRTNLYTP